MTPVEGQYHIAIYYEQEVDPNDIWYYKDKPYVIMEETKMKSGNLWFDVVIYQCLYENPDKMIWVRLKSDFYHFFKKKENGQEVL